MSEITKCPLCCNSEGITSKQHTTPTPIYSCTICHWSSTMPVTPVAYGALAAPNYVDEILNTENEAMRDDTLSLNKYIVYDVTNQGNAELWNQVGLATFNGTSWHVAYDDTSFECVVSDVNLWASETGHELVSLWGIGDE